MDQLDYGKYGIVSPFVVERKKVESRMNPSLVPQVHCEEFTHLSLMWREGKIPETPSKEIADVKAVFYKMHGDVPLECLDAVWGETEERFMRDPGFAAYYAQFCMRSEWYPRWPLNVPTARAVVGSFGYGWDLSGQFGQIPIMDDHAWWTEHHPVMRYLLTRGKNSAYLVEEQRAWMAATGELAQRKQRILVLGAGYMPWATMLNYRVNPAEQEILACDIDPRLTLTDLRQKFGAAVDGVDYRTGDLKELLGEQGLYGKFDIVLMDGLYIYLPPEQRTGLMDAVMRLLRPEGKFVYDDQCEHWAMKFAQTVFNWGYDGSIHLAASPETIVRYVDHYVRNRSVAVQVYPDAVNREPVGATIVLTKVQQRPS